ncbi:hypothetical protein DM02DRAFT_470119, partial [Periconia macrospinosa]
FPPEYISANRGPIAETVAYVFMVLMIIFVALRFLSRRYIKAKIGLDDWLTLPGLLFCIGMCIVTIVMVRVTGIGKHLPIVAITNPAHVVSWGKGAYAIECFHSLAVVFPRLSILASYMRIFIQRRYRYSAYVIGVIIILNSLAGIIVSLAQCHPFSARWSGSEAMTAHCINSMACIRAFHSFEYQLMLCQPAFRWLVLVNMITDVAMLILPLPVLWALKIGVREKLALIFIFTLGAVGFVTSTIRFTIFFKVKELTTDGTWLSLDLAIWSTIEPAIYLIAACLPPLRPL